MKHVAARSVKPDGDCQDGSQFESMLRRRTQHDGIILKMPKVDQEKRRLKKEREERRILSRISSVKTRRLARKE